MIIVLQLAIKSLLKSALGFGKAVEQKIARRKIGVSGHLVGIGRDSSLGHLDRSFIAACSMSRKARQETLGIWILPAGINLIPRFEGLVRLFQISRHFPVVG